jgi:hypothetical protein
MPVIHCFAPLRLRPTTPTIISKMLMNLSAVVVSRKYRIPIAAIRAVPAPDHTAYATATSIFFSASVGAANEAA